MSFLGEALLYGVPSIAVLLLLQNAVSRHSRQDEVSSSNAEVIEEKPYELPPLKRGASTHMNMGLRKFESFNWLTIDEHYLPEHDIRSRLLSDHRPSVLQCQPESQSACQEVLSEVTSFLTSRYPHIFQYSGNGVKRLIHNFLTGESFHVVNNPCPLETAARLAMEDFNLLIKDPRNGEYRLQASATLFPAGWKLEDRIGYTLTDLHNPVPAWKDKLGPHVNRYFDHLTPKTAMERHTLFVQMTSDLFQNASLCPPSNAQNSPDTSTLPTARQTDSLNKGHSSTLNPSLSNADTEVHNVNPTAPVYALSDIYVRRERQTFTRLPVSDAILFTVRTFMTHLTSLGDDELTAFMEQTRGWGGEMAAYKGRDQWWDTVLQYYQDRKNGAVGED